MRDHDATLSFTPLLPEGLTRLSFGRCFRDRRLKVEVKHHQARYSLLAGPPPQIIHHGQAVTVTTPSGELRDPKARRGRGPKSTLRTTPGTAATRGLNVAVSERGGHER
jgi:alpha,alpha-trehalose phosphorylase